MKDLNFFESYVETREFKLDRKFVYTSLGVFIIIVFFVHSIFNYIIIKQEEKAVASLKEIAENEKNLQKITEIKEKEIEVAEFRESVQEIILFNARLEETDIINTKLLDDITCKMPNEVFITSLTISASDIQIGGIAKDKLSIAEFEKGLESIDDLEDVFVSNIYRQNNHHNFNIKIMIEDMMIDGEINEEAEGETINKK